MICTIVYLFVDDTIVAGYFEIFNYFQKFSKFVSIFLLVFTLLFTTVSNLVTK